MNNLRVVLLDDHQVVLAGICDYLDGISWVTISNKFSISSEMIKYIKDSPPDIIITDYNMPCDGIHKDGLAFIGYLIRTFPNIKILVLTMITNPMIISALYDTGVSGVVFKQDSLIEIKSALLAIRANSKYYPPSLKKHSHKNEPSILLQDRINSLSPREFEVLRHFIEGESIAKIAERLNRSAKTISLQKKSAMRKLNVESNQELIMFCTTNNIFN